MIHCPIDIFGIIALENRLPWFIVCCLFNPCFLYETSSRLYLSPLSMLSRPPARYDRRDELHHYIAHPEKFPNAIVYASDDFVVVRDKFPKAIIHWIILTRNEKIMKIHPTKAFEDEAFKNQVRQIRVPRY